MFMCLRIPLTAKLEDKLYHKVLAGSNCLFFSMSGGVIMGYGVKPSLLDTKIMHYEEGDDVSSWGDCAIQVTPETFIRCLAKRSSIWGKATIPDADTMLAVYKDILSKYPDINKSILPPPESEERLLITMNENWGIITSDDLRQALPVPAHVLISVRNDARHNASLERLLQTTTGTVQSHNFLGSRMYRITHVNAQ